jgi:cbb3-type cytochrome oxidase maturation protein
MIVLFIVLPLALVLAGGAILAFIWSIRQGQLDDLSTPAVRLLGDDFEIKIPVQDDKNKS